MINPDIIEQLEYLIDEIELLRGIINVYPDGVLGERSPVGEPSIKEMFGVLVERDRKMAAVMDDEPAAQTPDWNSSSMDQLLADLVEERRSLLSRIASLPTVDLESDLHALVTDGGDQLRSIAYRLHEMPIGQFSTAAAPADDAE